MNGSVEDFVKRLRDVEQLLAKRLESAGVGVAGLKRDPTTGRVTFSEELKTRMAKAVERWLETHPEASRYGRAVGEVAKEVKEAYPQRRQISLSEAAPKPGTPAYEALIKDIDAAAMKLMETGQVKDPKIAREVARKTMVPYFIKQRRAFLEGYRDYVRAWGIYGAELHPSYEMPRKVAEVPPQEPPVRTMEDIRAGMKAEKRGAPTEFPVTTKKPITVEELEAVRRKPLAKDALHLVPAYDKKTKLVHHFTVDDLAMRVSKEPKRYEYVPLTRHVRERVPEKLTEPKSKFMPSGKRVIGETLGAPIEEGKTLPSSGWYIEKEGARETRAVAEKTLPEKIYGRPGGRGYWHEIETTTVPFLKESRAAAKKSTIGNFEEWWNGLSREEKIGWEVASRQTAGKLPEKELRRFLTTRHVKSLTPKAYAEMLAKYYVEHPEKFMRTGQLRFEQKFFSKALQSGRWRLPKKLLIAIGAAGALGAALWPKEAEAHEAGTVARGVAATTLRHKVLHPGYKRNDWSFITDPKKREEMERLEDEVEKVATSKRYKFGRDFFGSIFASYIGEKWATEVMGQEFDPSIAGYIVGELPLWLLGGKIMHSAIKGGALGAKLARSIGTGMIGRSIPQAMQVIHGDTTVGEAALSTAEEGAIWGAIDLVMKPLGGAAKYFLGVGKWNPAQAVTPEIVNGVEKSLMQKMVTYWPEKVGGPMWNSLVKLFRSIPGFERMFVPAVQRMNPEAADVFRKRIAQMGLKLDDAYRLYEKAYMGLNRSESYAATDLLRGVPGARVMAEHGLSLSRLNSIVNNHVKPIRKAFQERGGEAVIEGLLTADTYIKNINTYVPRQFWPQIKGLQEYVDEIRRVPFKPMSRKLRLELKRFMRRRDLPPELLQKMDMVNDVSYLTWRGLKDVITDTETAKLFNKLSTQRESFAYASRKVAEGEVKEFTHPLTKKLSFVRNESWLKRNGWMKLPGTKVKGAPKAAPGLYEFGALRGGWVPKEIAEELFEIGRIPGRYERLFSHILSKWKYGKVILRPATHARNLISNLILNDLGGLQFWKLHRYAEGARALRQRGANKYFKEALDEGLLSSGSYVRRELGGYWGAADKNFVDTTLAKIGKGGGEKFYNAWHKVRGGVRWMGQKPSKLYDVEEKLFKMAKFIDNRKKGIAAKEAAADAMKWTFNYGEITPFIRGVRTWAMPFVTFSYKAIPIVAETALKHPIRFAKWPLMAMGLTYASLDSLDIDAKHWNYIKRVLPKYMRSGHYMLLPYKDEKNRLQFVDLTYILPWGDIGELAQQGALRIMQNPAAQLTAQLSMNKNFYGQPIWYEWEKPKVKAFKVMSHIWRTMMPSWTPDLALGMDPTVIGGYDWYNFIRTCKQASETAPTPRQFAASMVGVKTRPIEPRREAVKRKRGKDWQIREAKAYYKRLMRENPDAIRNLVEERIKALDRIEDEYRRGGGYSVLNPLRYVE